MALFDPKTKPIAQLQKTIEDKNANISRLFDEIGKLYYEQYRDASVDVSKGINSRCESIAGHYLDIEACNLKILFEKGLKICSTCKKENPLEHAYCSVCGSKFPEGSDKAVEVPLAASVLTVGQQTEDKGIPAETGKLE